MMVGTVDLIEHGWKWMEMVGTGIPNQPRLYGTGVLFLAQLVEILGRHSWQNPKGAPNHQRIIGWFVDCP